MLFGVILTTLLPLGVDACLSLLLGCSSCCSGGGYSYNQQPYYPSYQQPYSYYHSQQYAYQTPKIYQQPQTYVQPRVQPQYNNPVYYARPAVPAYSHVPTGSYSTPTNPQNPYQTVMNPRPQVQVNVQPSSSYTSGSIQVPFVPPRAVGPAYVPLPQAILVESTTEKVAEELEESGSIIGGTNTYGEEMIDEEILEEVEQTSAPVRKLITNPPRVVTVPSIESEHDYAPEQPDGGEYEDEVTNPPKEEEYPDEEREGPVRTTPSSVAPYVPPARQKIPPVVETPFPYVPPAKQETYAPVPETPPPYVPPATPESVSETPDISPVMETDTRVSYSATEPPAEKYPDDEEEQATYVPTIPPVVQTIAPQTLAPYAQPTTSKATYSPQETPAPPPVEEVEYIEEEEAVTTEVPVPPAVEEKQFEEETAYSTPVDGGAGDDEESGGYGRKKSRRRSH